MDKKLVPLAIAQIAHETAGFTSRVSVELYNLSGIKYINKPYQKATKGTLSPEGNYYAKYESYNDWAVDYLRILSLGYKPINATNIRDFAYKLKQNNYYTDSASNYIAGMEAWDNKLSNVLKEILSEKKNYTAIITVVLVIVIILIYKLYII